MISVNIGLYCNISYIYDLYCNFMLSIFVDVLSLEAEEEEEAEHAEEDGGGEGEKTQDKRVSSQIS